ncbi:MAG: phosphonate C-P lyase system protein PhnH [Fusobacteriaceae bacterium]
MKIEKFDYVHDIQKNYRKILDSMSKPGKINELADNIKNLEVHSSLSKEIMTLAYTLLNIDSNFYSENKEEEKYIQLHTFARGESVEKSEFIFIDIRNEEVDKVLNIMQRASKGTLEAPHEGATLILHVEEIIKSQGLVLSGPGIKDKSDIFVVGLDEKILKNRAEINSEFPLGVDFILIDNSGKIICLPRTTKIEVMN